MGKPPSTSLAITLILLMFLVVGLLAREYVGEGIASFAQWR
jgi:hypothetical protein